MKIITLLSTLAFLLSTAAFAAEDSPLCTNLSRYSCAPGNYKDKTGTVTSSADFQKFVLSYAAKTTDQLTEKFKKILSNPDNAYFKELSIAALGLKNSPQCSSTNANDIKNCEDNLLEGLVILAQKETLSPMIPQASLARMGNLSDVSYIMQNDTYRSVIQDIKKQVATDLKNRPVENKISNTIYPEIQALLLERVGRLPITDKQKQLMLKKIKGIHFAGFDCTDADVSNKNSDDGTQALSSLLIPNAFYRENQSNFHFCSGLLLQATSEFEIAYVIAHELAHSIDPCQIAGGPADNDFKYTNTNTLLALESQYPLPNVLNCLRGSKSVGAQSLALKHNTVPISTSKIYGVGTDDAPQEPKPIFCAQDQITESFADWLAVEVVPQYIEKNYKLTPEQYREGYSNTFRSLCWAYSNSTQPKNNDVHPLVDARIDRILLVNPKVRAQMSCPIAHPDYAYCDSDKKLEPAIQYSNPTTQPAGSAK